MTQRSMRCSMQFVMRAVSTSSIAALAWSAMACGPTKVLLDPRDVVNVNVRPASGQLLYCPGDPFQVEVVAKLKNGSSCSSTNKALGCNGKTDAVIDPLAVKITADNASPKGEADDFVFVPNADPLSTAATGVGLHAWIQTAVGKSLVGDSALKPVYSCQYQNPFGDGSPSNYGQSGGAGPNLRVSITTLSTPWYPDAALVRIEAPSYGIVRYVISASADQPIVVSSNGQPGAPGQPGESGKAGVPGRAGDSECESGTNGGRGADGGDGMAGGNGGPGGAILLVLDDAASAKLGQRIHLSSPGGQAGPGGSAGSGGMGGAGGAPGPSGKSCSGKWGEAGQAGNPGNQGVPGVPGNDGPFPIVQTASRDSLFAPELATIRAIEAAKAKK